MKLKAKKQLEYFFLSIRHKLSKYTIFKNFYSKVDDFYAFFDKLKENNKLKQYTYLNLSIAIVFLLILLVNSVASSSQINNGLKDNKIVVTNLLNSEIYLGKLYTPPSEATTTASQQDENPATAPVTSDSQDIDLTIAQSSPTNIAFRAKSLSAADQKKFKISIIITNLGLNRPLLDQAFTLSRGFTLGFSPYTLDLGVWIDKAYSYNFECMTLLPMEPTNYLVNDPGPLSILTKQPTSENLAVIEQIIIQSYKSIGFYSPKDEVFSMDRNSITPVLEKLSNENMIFINTNSQANSNLESFAKPYNLELRNIDLILDETIDRRSIEQRLNHLTSLAAANGSAIAVVEASPLVLEILANWESRLDRSNYILTPTSTLFPKRVPNAAVSSSIAPSHHQTTDVENKKSYGVLE